MRVLIVSGCNCIWESLGVSESIWEYFAASEVLVSVLVYLWEYLGVSGCIWEYLGVSGSL